MPEAAPRTAAPARPAAAARPASSAARTAAPARRPASGGGPVPAGPAVKLSGETAKDPRFKKALDKLQERANKARQHEPASKKAADAQAAALPPPNEKLAGAKANQVDTMKSAETKKPDNNSFLSMLRAEIQKVMPKKTEDAGDFMKGDDRQQLKGAMTGNINQQKEEAAGGVKSASNQPPDQSKVQGKEVKPVPAEPAPEQPAPIGAADAMPAPKPAEDLSLEKQKGKPDTDVEMEKAEITTPQMQKANDPRFTKVLTTKGEADKQAKEGPVKYRATEGKVLAEAGTKAVADEKQGLTTFKSVKGAKANQVKSRQQLAKEKDEKARKEVTDHIEGIYARTKEAVDKKLESIETEVTTAFDAGADAAVVAMKDYVETRFDDRYSGISGKALWLKDKLLPLPSEVKAWFDQAYAKFQQDLDTLVVRIAALVETRLAEAKAMIAAGQKEISEYVKGLSPALQEVGKAAEKEMAGRFDELRQGVDEKKNDLAQKLAQRYKEAQDKGAAALKEMQDAHKSLVERVIDAIAEIVEILRKFRDRVMGMLKKGKQTIDLIISDPIGFLSNLLDAIKMGINRFKDNIWEHLKQGFFKWLFGSLADAGITIPKDFSLPSILQLVLQILGLTYARLRAKAVKLIGERNVALLEKAFELLQALWNGGPAALWEKLKEFLSDLKEQIVGEIQNWVVTTIIKAAITKLATMFNPVGAIIQAIITIYNTVMFFIERINQILDFVEAVINSVHKIATGDLGSAASWIEQALARTIPIIIGFLARLLGISGITDKIVGFIKKIQTKVDQAVDKVIEKVVGGIKKLFGGGKDNKPDERTPDQKAQDLKKAVNEAKGLTGINRRWPAINLALNKIKDRYRLKELTATKQGKLLKVKAAVNPELTFEMNDEEAVDEKLQQGIDLAKSRIQTVRSAAEMDKAIAIVTESINMFVKDPPLQLEFKSRGGPVGRMVYAHSQGQPPKLLGVIMPPGQAEQVLADRGNQKLVRSKISGKEYVFSSTGSRIQRYVSRNINVTEREILSKVVRTSGGETVAYPDLPSRPAQPGYEREPVTRDPLTHVLNAGVASIFSSATITDSGAIQNRVTKRVFNENGVIKIDLLEVASANIIDLSSQKERDKWGFAGKGEQANQDPQVTGEVLIKGGIPGKAIAEFKPR